MDKERLKARLEEIKRSHSYPSKTEMIKNLSQSVVNNVTSVLAGNDLTSSEQLANSRLAICRQCEFFDQSQERCKKCGCKMAIKTYLKAEKCPIGKW